MNTLLEASASSVDTDLPDLAEGHPPSLTLSEPQEQTRVGDLAPVERIALTVGRALVAWSGRNSYDPGHRERTALLHAIRRAREQRELSWQRDAALTTPRR